MAWLRRRVIRGHIGQGERRNTSGLDGRMRSVRVKRKQIEEIFGWMMSWRAAPHAL